MGCRGRPRVGVRHTVCAVVRKLDGEERRVLTPATYSFDMAMAASEMSEKHEIESFMVV